MPTYPGTLKAFAVRVEDRPRRVVLIFDHDSNVMGTTKESAAAMAILIEQVVAEYRTHFKPATNIPATQEAGQVSACNDGGSVVLMIDFMDRIYFYSIEAVAIVASAIREAATNAMRTGEIITVVL